MGDNKNFFPFLAISIAILFGYQFFIAGPRNEEALIKYDQQMAEQAALDAVNGTSIGAPTASDAPLAPTKRASAQSNSLAYQDAGFVGIETAELSGSISLRGGHFDDLTLVKHKVSMEDGAENVRLFEKFNAEEPYYADFSWYGQTGTKVPDLTSAWTSDHDLLTPETPVTLAWDNGEGAKYMMYIEVDDQFMFTVTQSVINTSDKPLTLAPYGAIRRSSIPESQGLYILHEGMIGVFGGILEEISYDDIADDGEFDKPSTGGWMGITDKFWMATLIPDNKIELKRARFKYTERGGQGTYSADYAQDWQVVAPGASLETTNRIYAGAKIVGSIDEYAAKLDIVLFDRAIDWGYFWFLTQPIFVGLHYLFEITGNYGIAILMMTVVLKLLLFPLANKSYVSMSHMKKAQPKIKALQEKYGDDKQKMQQEMMALYKKEKINPMAGCLPMIPQMFIFFSLYKTLLVTIEMRHQPFFGWITYLSAADPLTPVNLFGLIPWDPPSFLAIGVLPILMGASMYLQQKMNPQQASMDPAQQKIMNMLPFVFTFIMASFSAGLVLYWTWNNILSIAQQSLIMRREAAKNA
ncbi:MAG: membrane protein insertase YidC [Kordiimonadaceae bacterium]|nr:membrane protein insertase YidC [Kordiimonadaceae bacterium]